MSAKLEKNHHRDPQLVGMERLNERNDRRLENCQGDHLTGKMGTLRKWAGYEKNSNTSKNSRKVVSVS